MKWNSVQSDGMPPCDGETVFVGINSAGFACCFNDARPDGLCLMGSPECSTAQMSELRWWRVLDRPDAAGVSGGAPNTEAMRWNDRFMEVLAAIHGPVDSGVNDSARLAFAQTLREFVESAAGVDSVDGRKHG